MDQLGAVAEYISRTSSVYADQMVQRIADRLQQVREFPASGARVPEVNWPEVRQVFVTPYRIIYRMHDDVIEVIGIVHGRRDLRSEDLV